MSRTENWKTEKKKGRPPEEEVVEEELERPQVLPLNLRKSAFDRGGEGINTRPSVFTRQAVFHPEG